MEEPAVSLEGYAEHAAVLAQELIDSLSEADVEALRASLSGGTLHDWDRWRAEHEEAVAAFVSATPSQRARKTQWKEAWLHLTLAAAQHCLEAAALLRATDRLTPGYSYRQMASIAGCAYQDLTGRYIPDWPFDGDNPFAES
jgi:hypothetical protein